MGFGASIGRDVVWFAMMRCGCLDGGESGRGEFVCWFEVASLCAVQLWCIAAMKRDGEIAVEVGMSPGWLP